MSRKYQRLIKKWNKDHNSKRTLDDVFQLMLIKGRMGAFQSFDPKDFGADYDQVPLPKDGTDEAEFWFRDSIK